MSVLRQESVPVGSLSPNPWNTNQLRPEDEEKLKNSMTRFGMFKPIVVRTLRDGTLEILGGEHRWLVARELGYKEVPVVNLGEVPDQRAKEIGLVDNARYGADDTLSLAQLLKELGDTDELQEFLPFSQDDLASIFAANTIALDDLDDLAAPEDSTPERERPSPRDQLMRFKVPVEDVAPIAAYIERVMKEHGFNKDDSLTNAGLAFVHIMNRVMKELQ